MHYLLFRYEIGASCSYRDDMELRRLGNWPDQVLFTLHLYDAIS